MINQPSFNGSKPSETPSWLSIIKKYNKPDLKKSIWQIINSLGPYVLLWYLMYLSLGISYWITLGLAFLAAGFMVRIFIIFHDCGHGSFFRSQRTNKIVGTLLGSLVFTPYDKWHGDHAIHHSTVGNLDKRGVGDVWTLTVEEYIKLPLARRLLYRFYRNPVFLFGIAPLLSFLLLSRVPRRSMGKPEQQSVYITNIIVALFTVGLGLLIGFKAFLMIQLPIIFIASSAGVWLFYVQHQFEDVIWSRQDIWDYKTMALKGSSFLKLPRILQWFSGNIGFHHIHHLSPMIPNYHLEQCHREITQFEPIKPITLFPGLRTMKLRLWNEQLEKLMSFKDLRKLSTSST